MMDLDKLDDLLLKHFSQILNKTFLKIEDLLGLTSRELLVLGNAIDEIIVPLYVQMLKRANPDADLFQKLMGDHEIENKELVDSFFDRYMKAVMEPTDEDFNPILAYLPVEYFSDLAFLNSREVFFKSQSIHHVNEFLEEHFENPPVFSALEMNKAWNWFFNQALSIK